MKFGVPFLGIGAACALCCAPLLVPLIGGSGLIAAWANVSADTMICSAIVAGLFVLAGWWMIRQHRKQAAFCACPTACIVDECPQPPSSRSTPI